MSEYRNDPFLVMFAAFSGAALGKLIDLVDPSKPITYIYFLLFFLTLLYYYRAISEKKSNNNRINNLLRMGVSFVALIIVLFLDLLLKIS